jgi:putative ABC transport system substrate-binding protein
MRRREFLSFVGGAATWPMVVHAQQSTKLPTIGFMGTTTPSVWQPWTAAFVQRLRELGWIEGRTVAIEYRWAEGRADRWGEIAAEFARLKVDIVVTAGVAAVNAAKQAMPATPIVFPLANDPVSAGVVASLARPGGNVTGLASKPALSCPMVPMSPACFGVLAIMWTKFCGARSPPIFLSSSRPSSISRST